MKKFDKNQLIGVFLISGILIWMNLTSKNKKLAAPKEDTTSQTATPEQKTAVDTEKTVAFNAVTDTTQTTSIAPIEQSKALADEVIENDLVKITVASKGAQVKEVLLKKYKSFDGQPLYLVQDNNA